MGCSPSKKAHKMKALHMSNGGPVDYAAMNKEVDAYNAKLKAGGNLATPAQSAFNEAEVARLTAPKQEVVDTAPVQPKKPKTFLAGVRDLFASRGRIA